MKGNSKIVQNDDTFRAQNITLNLDTQEIFLEERVKGSVSASEKKSGEKNPDAENSAESETEKIGGENGRE
jgi:lipopolysaccharide export system protein LptA